jgi:flavin reductase (DIM6/NTAB) family NADH-FMN oxidoreductase RutF
MAVPLPEALKKKLRPTSQWLAISLPAPQQLVDVRLIAAGREFDVTSNSSVAAMRPFVLRVGLDPELGAVLRQSPAARLHMVDRALGRTLGVLKLRHLRDWEAADARMALFDIVAGTQYCAPWPRRAWDTFMYRRAARRKPPQSQLMLPAAVEQMMTFYLCPRPVYFVSVDDGTHSNIFPMDLVGPLQPDRFTMALRNTSPSVETMKSTRRLALGDIPGSACEMAYQLGAHHKKLQVDWDTLPFKALRSQRFALRIPDIALRIREVELMDFQTVGSHTLFIGRIVSEQPLRPGPQLFHTSGVHQRLRTRLGSPLQEAPPAARA